MMMVKVKVQNRNRLNENDALKRAFLWRRALGDVKNGARKRVNVILLLLFFTRLQLCRTTIREPRCVKETLSTVAIYDPFFFGISTGFESKKAWNVMKWAYISSKCFYPRVRVCSFNSVEQRARLTRLIKDLGVQSSAFLIFREALKDQGRLVTTYRRSVTRFYLETLLHNPS